MKKIYESEIHKAVVDHWKNLGMPRTMIATIPNMGAMGQHGLTKGLPDLILIAPGLHGYLELKAEGGKLSPAQQDFQSICIARGIPFYVTYGRDEPIRLLEELGIVRKAI
jgi:hypothetical protein